MMDGEDRISQLPQHILQNHILSLLPQNDAVRTCVLSKSWRHLGPTRPKIEFLEHKFPGTKQEFLSVVEKTLKRYDDHNISIQDFVFYSGSNKSCPLLNKLIAKLQMLKRLSLGFVWITDETFEKIMTSCPSIQHLVLDSCCGLRAVKLNKPRNLKHFDSSGFNSIEINDDAPSLETIRLTNSRNWYLNKNNFFPRLKSLRLWCVHLRTTADSSFGNLLSNNCPCLEELILDNCSGFTQFELSSRSIKRLTIYVSNSLIPVEVAFVIDAANMLYFQFTALYLPPISFKTTSRECKSVIKVWPSSHSNAHVSSSTWSLKLHEFLKALSLSQISLQVDYLQLACDQDTNNTNDGEPVVVEHLCLSGDYFWSSQLGLLLNCVFRICRPRYIGLSLYSYSLKIQLAESMWKTLVNKGQTTECNFWQQDLEGSSIQVSDENTNEWRCVQVPEFSNNQSIRFRLKWKRDFIS